MNNLFQTEDASTHRPNHLKNIELPQINLPNQGGGVGGCGFHFWGCGGGRGEKIVFVVQTWLLGNETVRGGQSSQIMSYYNY